MSEPWKAWNWFVIENRTLKARAATPHGELTITLLAGIATFERHLIRSRTDEGRKRAMARGVQFGRPPKLTPFQRQEAIARLERGETQADVARGYNVSQATMSILANAG